MKILLSIIIALTIFAFFGESVFAAVDCSDPANKNNVECVFGTIKPPEALENLVKQDSTGAGGIGNILSRLIALFYMAAAIVLIFMLLWGAFDWMTSEGDKEKLESAKRKIINAIIGIILFAVAFAAIQLLGAFTGFKFFEGQRGVQSACQKGAYSCPGGTVCSSGSFADRFGCTSVNDLPTE